MQNSRLKPGALAESKSARATDGTVKLVPSSSPVSPIEYSVIGFPLTSAQMAFDSMVLSVPERKSLITSVPRAVRFVPTKLSIDSDAALWMIVFWQSAAVGRVNAFVPVAALALAFELIMSVSISSAAVRVRVTSP